QLALASETRLLFNRRGVRENLGPLNENEGGRYVETSGMTGAHDSRWRGMQALAAAVVLALGGCSSGGGSDSEVPPLGNNRAPAISGEPPASTKVGEAWSFSPTASDADGDPLTFTI